MTTETKPLNVEIFMLAGAKRRDVKRGPLYGFYLPDGKFVGVDIFLFPAIDENFQLTLDWLVPIMRECGYGLNITDLFKGCDPFIAWRTLSFPPDLKGKYIKDCEYAKAACEAAKPILEERAKYKGENK